jgi:dUTP diphosphatase
MEADSIRVQVARLSHADGLDLPRYETPGAAGMDLPAAVVEPVEISPNTSTLIPTGLTVAIPRGFEGQIRPRSGLAMKHGITLPNTPGTIDSDYRGEIKVIVMNLGPEPFLVTRGMRIAQIVFTPIVQAVWEKTDELPPSDRGEGGFGHTGS